MADFIKKIAKKDWPIIFLVPIFFIYLYNLSPGIFSADSGEFAAVAKILGVPHPPGYPTYTLISHFFLKVPLDLTSAGKIGLFSVLTSVLTLYFLYKLLNLLFDTVSFRTRQKAGEKSSKALILDFSPGEAGTRNDDLIRNNRSSNLIRNKIISLIAVYLLAFCYPFWLYSEVVEVFSLNNLFAVILLYLTVLIYQEKEKSKISNYLYLFCFFIGLSLTHHHTIVLTFPALILLLYPKRKFLKDKLLNVKCLLLFILGFSFYLYVPLAAKNNPAINWDNAVNLKNFFRLFSRADYGSFVYSQSGGSQALAERLLQIPFFFYFIMMDLGIIGFFLGIIGFIYLFIKEKRLFISLFAGFLFSGPLFAFYSSFPIYTSFVLGVFERFLILAYIFWILGVSFGILVLTLVIKQLFLKIGIKRILPLALTLTEIIFLILPLKIFLLNRQKINLKDNYLGDYVGRDILNSLPKNSIVLLMGDLFVFNTQYVYYNLGYRNDVKIVLASRFHLKYIRENFKKTYPEVLTPKNIEDKNFLYKLIELNKNKYPIFSVLIMATPGKWYPYGFLYRLYPQKNIDEKKINEEVEYVFSKYHALEKYKKNVINNFLFSDIFQMYAMARITTGKYFVEKELYDKAKPHFLKAKELDPDLSEIYQYLGFIFSKEKKCQEAEKNFFTYQEKSKSQDKSKLYYYLEKNAQECFKDKKKADQYHQLYLKEKSKKQTPL